MITKHLFIINPVAGKTNSFDSLSRKIHDAMSCLDPVTNPVEIKTTAAKGDAGVFTKAAADDADEVRVYACGGDGTINEVVSAAVGLENVSVCPVPVGSGNDFVRCFDGYEREDFLDIDACMRGESIPCDVMRAGDYYSVNIISVGLDAVVGARQKNFKRIPGISGGMAYKVALALSFMTAMKNKISFEIDGVPFDVGSENITLAVAGNGKWYGGGFKATPYADISDGLMDFVTIRTISRLEFLKYVSIYKKGEHIEKMPFVKYVRCKKIKMLSDKPIIIQFDGEVHKIQNPEIEIIPAATRIILPKKDR